MQVEGGAKGRSLAYRLLARLEDRLGRKLPLRLMPGRVAPYPRSLTRTSDALPAYPSQIDFSRGVAALAEAVRGGPTPLFSGRTALHLTEIVLALNAGLRGRDAQPTLTRIALRAAQGCGCLRADRFDDGRRAAGEPVRRGLLFGLSGADGAARSLDLELQAAAGKGQVFGVDVWQETDGAPQSGREPAGGRLAEQPTDATLSLYEAACGDEGSVQDERAPLALDDEGVPSSPVETAGQRG